MYGATDSYSHHHYQKTLVKLNKENELMSEKEMLNKCCCNTINCISDNIFKVNQGLALTIRELHPFRCRSPVCEYTTACCLMGTFASALCWIPGTVLWSSAPSAKAVIGGKALVGIGAGTTCVATSCGLPTTFYNYCMSTDTDIWYESY